MIFIANALAAVVGMLVGAAGAGYKIRGKEERSARDAERKLHEQGVAMRALEERLAQIASYSEAAAAARAQALEEERIDPETLAVITAAVTVALNKRVRITSAQLARPGNTWTHQGRVGVQTSHNLKSRR
jgi:hypothetical protein